MLKREPAAPNADASDDPYAAAVAGTEDDTAPLSWQQKAFAGCLSGSVGLLVMALLLTVLGLAVTVLYDSQPWSRETTHLLITVLLAGGILLSLGISLLAGTRSFRKLRRIIGALSGPTAARVELERQVATLLKDRRSS